MRNPIRRSKNIGKTQGGRVKDGRPKEKWSRMFPQNQWDQISERDGKWNVFVENPSRDYFHPCKPEEYLEVLRRLPSNQTKHIKGIILRRLRTIDKKLMFEARARYSCVILNAFPKSMVYEFDKKPSTSTKKNYKPFCSDWTYKNGIWTLNWDLPGLRRYYLYRIFLHEIGHLMDAGNIPSSYNKRENYAESFARDMAEWLEEV